ncbi:hypothetical protein STRCI_006410 [Streptomyces cinnabarinus]|uniref:AB hydrolase-1 domain-containing protein n=1 Tax=Streptomyces cinnabarinus TaxID=67287 RepID=A0ABY7KLR0_9ACTN|nr:hypothetical protein [Streptomyces cinnabarinus]WAZ24953.1 hypothetical protein STRCI_006410 [Streptomyces cinnabarinus]
MTASGSAQLLFVHGIGGLRDADRERRAWLDSLADGARRAGHSDAVSRLTQGWPADVRFADYSDLFLDRGAQGDTFGPSQNDEAFLSRLVAELTEELAHQALERQAPDLLRMVENARQQLSDEQTQGIGEPLRILAGVLTTLLQIPGLRRAAQWASGRSLLGQLSQVGRYLGRGEPDGGGRCLDTRVRDRVLRGLDPGRPLVVVAHSLGTVVAFEALQHYSGPVRLLITLGSPLATATAVLHRIHPRPPRTPEPVERWLNFWDRDDIVVCRPRIQDWMLPNRAGVLPDSHRVDSDGIWVHTATKYLRQTAVAGPVVEALKR